MPDPDRTDDDDWCAYLVGEGDALQVVRLEWWLHGPSGHVFLARRDIVADQVLETFDSALLPPELRDQGGVA